MLKSMKYYGTLIVSSMFQRDFIQLKVITNLYNSLLWNKKNKPFVPIYKELHDHLLHEVSKLDNQRLKYVDHFQILDCCPALVPQP